MKQPPRPQRSRRVGGALLIAAALLLGGCAMFAPPRPYATEAEVLASRGYPTHRWDNGDGTATLAYATQPFGETCLMVTVDAQGRVLRQEDALADAGRARVRPGMTREEVFRLFGPHRSVEYFSLSREEVWDWNIENTGPGVATLFNVHFVDGRVVRTSQSYIHFPF